MDAAATRGQPVRDQSVQPRCLDAGEPAVRRHARRRPDRARRTHRFAVVGDTGRRHDGRLQHHQPAAGREGQGDPRRRRRRVRDQRLHRRLRCGHGQTVVAIRHDSRARRIRPRNLEGRQLEDGRRRDLADRHLRSAARYGVLAGGQSRAPDRSVDARRSRQSLQRLGGGARSEHRSAQVALSVHAQRRSRLGFGRGHGPRRPDVAGPEPQTAAARGSQRTFLRAGSHQRRVPVRHAVRLPELEQGLRRQGPAPGDPGLEFESRRQLPRLSHAGRRHEFPGAVL